MNRHSATRTLRWWRGVACRRFRTLVEWLVGQHPLGVPARCRPFRFLGRRLKRPRAARGESPRASSLPGIHGHRRVCQTLNVAACRVAAKILRVSDPSRHGFGRPNDPAAQSFGHRTAPEGSHPHRDRRSARPRTQFPEPGARATVAFLGKPGIPGRSRRARPDSIGVAVRERVTRQRTLWPYGPLGRSFARCRQGVGKGQQRTRGSAQRTVDGLPRRMARRRARAFFATRAQLQCCFVDDWGWFVHDWWFVGDWGFVGDRGFVGGFGAVPNYSVKATDSAAVFEQRGKAADSARCSADRRPPFVSSDPSPCAPSHVCYASSRWWCRSSGCAGTARACRSGHDAALHACQQRAPPKGI